jgi:hypothetical protein
MSVSPSSTSRGPRARRTTVTLARGSEAVAVHEHHLALLVRTLRGAGSDAADTIAEEVSALALAGVRIDLLPSAAELDALIAALIRIQAAPHGYDATFGRILSAARKEENA